MSETEKNRNALDQIMEAAVRCRIVTDGEKTQLEQAYTTTSYASLMTSMTEQLEAGKLNDPLATRPADQSIVNDGLRGVDHFLRLLLDRGQLTRDRYARIQSRMAADQWAALHLAVNGLREALLDPDMDFAC